MDVTTLLSRLDGVKATGQGTWVCRCPAHEDRTPSMSVKELPDGRILMNDFGGCSTEDILSVLGLAMGDLFPEPLTTYAAPTRAFTAMDALRCLAYEGSIVALANADLLEGKPVDQARLGTALGRINTALEVVGGR